jgi:Trypsin-like peptidase domain
MVLIEASAMVPRLRFQVLTILITIAALAAWSGLLRAAAFQGGHSDEDRTHSAKNSGSQHLAIATGVPSDERVELIGAARDVRRSVVLLIADDFRCTGFILSQRHRLVVTAGHVADYFVRTGSLFAVLEGSSQARRVERAWYHPRIKREFDFGLLATSFDHRDGPISLYSPDLAVVQLANDSEELPDGCEVCIDEDSALTVGRAVGVLGYWGNHRWPTAKDPAYANLAASAVRPPTERAEGTPEPFKCLFLRDVEEIPGGSGSPVFLGNGHVVGVVIGGFRDSLSSKSPGHLCGARIAELDELIAYHGLQGLVPRPTKPVALLTDCGPDPRIQQLRQAVVRVRQARELRRSGRYRDAVVTCNEILEAMPDYGGALLERSKSYLYFLATYWARLSAEERHHYARWAYTDSQQCDSLEWAGPHVMILNLQNFVYDSVACSNTGGFRFIVDRTTHILGPDWSGEPLTEHETGWVLNLRAQAHHSLGEMDEARDDYDESIRIEPKEARWYLNRAQFCETSGHTELGRVDRAIAENVVRTRNCAHAKH